MGICSLCSMGAFILLQQIRGQTFWLNATSKTAAGAGAATEYQFNTTVGMPLPKRS